MSDKAMNLNRDESSRVRYWRFSLPEGSTRTVGRLHCYGDNGLPLGAGDVTLFGQTLTLDATGSTDIPIVTKVELVEKRTYLLPWAAELSV